MSDKRDGPQYYAPDGTKLVPERMAGDAHDIRPMGRYKGSVSHLTPEQEADNAEHDRVMAEVREALRNDPDKKR